MGALVKYGTAGAKGGGWSAQPGTLQPSYEESRHEPRWQWQCRSPKTWRDRNRFDSLWSFGCRMSGGLGSGADGGFANLSVSDPFEPFSCDGEGTQTLKFIKGQCVDASGNVAAGAVVQAFRTSNDAFAGEVNSNSTDGRFDVPSPYPGVAHYLVAYKPGSPDIGGTTVNTLVPTGIDGV
jgi:hypothetical protein